MVASGYTGHFVTDPGMASDNQPRYRVFRTLAHDPDEAFPATIGQTVTVSAIVRLIEEWGATIIIS
jgi:hypothetical protein